MSLTFDHAHAASLLLPDIDAPGIETDRAIEAAARDMLLAMPCCELTHVTISAQDGVVRLDGTVTDGRWLARYKNKLTGALPSVQIDDRLDWIVPDCGIGYA